MGPKSAAATEFATRIEPSASTSKTTSSVVSRIACQRRESAEGAEAALTSSLSGGRDLVQGKKLNLLRFHLALKFVADSANCQQHFGAGGGRLQLFAQPANMDIYGAVIDIAVFAPDARQDGLPVEYAPPV